MSVLTFPELADQTVAVAPSTRVQASLGSEPGPHTYSLHISITRRGDAINWI